MAARLPSLALPPAERVHAADRLQRLRQPVRVIAAVIDDRLAVAVRNAGAIRISSARIMLRRRTSAGSSLRLQATTSMIRSIAKTASGRPAPR
jgi:hypothetical protein